MFQRQQVEQLLRLNGVSTDDSDDQIKSVLISAQWHKDDVETAILVLRENVNDQKTRVDSLHKVFRSDDHLRPETISSLLGIEMDVTSQELEQRQKIASGRMQPRQILLVAVMALTVSLIFVVASMMYLEMGLFYKTMH